MGLRPRYEFRSLPQSPTIRTLSSTSSSPSACGSPTALIPACPGPSNTTAFIFRSTRSNPSRSYDHSPTRVYSTPMQPLYSWSGEELIFPTPPASEEHMTESALQLDPCDNVIVALKPLKAGTVVRYGDHSCAVTEDIPVKHKLAIADLAPGDFVFLYGMVVGEAVVAIPRGGLISTRTIRHRASDYTATRLPVSFPLPDPAPWAARTFMGYRRADGQVGTRNYWIVLPLVFCENRNVDRMREALEEELGYGGSHNSYRSHVRHLVQHQASGNDHRTEDLAHTRAERVFPHIDGIRFLTHEGGCGGTRQDAQALCGLLAGYI